MLDTNTSLTLTGPIPPVAATCLQLCIPRIRWPGPKCDDKPIVIRERYHLRRLFGAGADGRVSEDLVDGGHLERTATLEEEVVDALRRALSEDLEVVEWRLGVPRASHGLGKG